MCYSITSQIFAILFFFHAFVGGRNGNPFQPPSQKFFFRPISFKPHKVRAKRLFATEFVYFGKGGGRGRVYFIYFSSYIICFPHIGLFLFDFVRVLCDEYKWKCIWSKICSLKKRTSATASISKEIFLNGFSYIWETHLI